MNDRLKEVRKTLGLNQSEFGSRLGITGPGISKIESGDRNLTEHMALAVCREFGVSYDWLKCGKGKMFVDQNNEDIAAMVNRLLDSEDEITKRLFVAFAKLPKEDWAALANIIEKLSKK